MNAAAVCDKQSASPAPFLGGPPGFPECGRYYRCIPRFQDIMRAPALEFLPAYLPTFDERRLAGQLGLWTAAALVYAAATRESLALWTLSAGSEKACEPAWD